MSGRDISCRELVELVTHYLDDALQDADRARFEAHLRICPPCVEYIAQLERTIAIVGASWRELEHQPEVVHLLAAFRDWKRGSLGGATA